MIAINGNVPNPFITFLKYLLVPTLLNLFLAYLLLRLFYRKHFHGQPFAYSQEPIKDPRLATLSRISLILLVILIVAKMVTVLLGLEIDFRLTYIALIAALPVIVFIPKRPGILRRIDWYTLIFFASMFVLMQSVWDSGFFQSAINATHLNVTSTGVILAVSVLLSQLISNVPLVALYLPVLMQAGAATKEMMALAAGKHHSRQPFHPGRGEQRDNHTEC